MFIAVDILLDRIRKEKEVDVMGTILQMHTQRMKMIQTLVGFDSALNDSRTLTGYKGRML